MSFRQKTATFSAFVPFYRHKLYNQCGMVCNLGGKGYATMRYICQLAIIAILLLSVGCAQMDNAPRHTADEVLVIAKSFSPLCRVEVASEHCG
jgi:hypothetical protein